MSAASATIIALLFYVAGLIPVVASATLRNGRRVAIAFVSGLLGLVIWQTGFFQRPNLAPTNVVVQAGLPTEESQCREVMQAIAGTGLSIDLSDAKNPRLAGSGADAVPPEIRDVLFKCAVMLAP